MFSLSKYTEWQIQNNLLEKLSNADPLTFAKSIAPVCVNSISSVSPLIDHLENIQFELYHLFFLY